MPRCARIYPWLTCAAIGLVVRGCRSFPIPRPNVSTEHACCSDKSGEITEDGGEDADEVDHGILRRQLNAGASSHLAKADGGFGILAGKRRLKPAPIRTSGPKQIIKVTTVKNIAHPKNGATIKFPRVMMCFSFVQHIRAKNPGIPINQIAAKAEITM